MRKLIYIMALLNLQFAAYGGTSSQNSQSDVVREQLTGLKSVSLVLSVNPFHIPEYAEIGWKIEAVVKKHLLKAGLSLGDEQGAVLSIGVDAYTIDDKALKDRIIIQVWTKLQEEATLKRAPSLGNPHGYDTWDTNWVELIRKKDVATFALDEVKEQIEEFCGDWELARDWVKNKRHPN